MSEQQGVLFQNKERKMTVKEIFFKYFSYFSFFILSVIICLGAAVLYVRYKVPVYTASAQMFVKNDERRGGSVRGSGSNDLIDAAMGGSRVNLDNEIELIKAKNIITRAVVQGGLNMRYFNKGKIRTSELYASLPFKCTLVSKKDSSSGFLLTLSNLTDAGADLNIGKEVSNSGKRKIEWGIPFYCNDAYVILNKNQGVAFNNETPYQIRWEPAANTASEIAGSLGVAPLSQRTTIIVLSLRGSSPERCAEILNNIIQAYKTVNLEEKNRIAGNTIQFIDQRLAIVTQELGGVETNLKEFKTANKFISATNQLQQFMEDYSATDKTILDLEIRKQVIGSIEDFINNPANADRIIPSNLGVDDGTLTALIVKYNELILRKERETPMQAPSSLVIADINNQLGETRTAIRNGVSLIRRRLQDELNNFKTRSSRFQSELIEMPAREKVLKEISRQQSIKEGLYLYLMQKREETAITSSSTISNYEQIDKAVFSYAPIEPDARRIKLFALVLGVLLPFGIIYLKDIMNDKVITRDDITKKTDTPVVGEIGHSKDMQTLVVAHKSRSIISEQFRIIRTNLQFLLGNNKTLLITSSVSGEGKSFVSLNLAAVMAISGKRVALLEFDLRKPRIINQIGVERKNKGISNYLAGQAVDINDLYYTLDDYPSLHIYGCGPIPPNPAELMLGSYMRPFFDALYANYDIIIIDSAPVGLVSDSFTLHDYAQATIYVVRQRYTLKKQLEFVDEIYRTQKLRNLGLVINDVMVGDRYGYYGFGNGYGYGGYSYGNYFDDLESKPWWQRFKWRKNKN
ncbi:GumC family protein [Sediminibacterium ginsengisoli]|uniref:Capsular exopolysaccharide family n=1 Tax=Sediminibacterium ginsengisoli TaxID=413434 RepID=A0A1T4Q6F0_9BACT|nr:tyrosine-protein kinase [Sediminibacterium ginsengisoli]SJZ99279.1 capsular exopolysaccharide family [Sediminibacterium ginsengisoli]